MKRIINKKYLILIPILILNIISLFYLHNTEYFIKHLIYIIISYILLFFTSKIKLKYIKHIIRPLYYFNIILLIIVLLFGKEINGSKAWIHIYSFSFQPSELLKISLILYLSLIINKKTIYLLTLTLIPSILIFLEPDTGSIIFLIIILLSVLKYKNINKKNIIAISIFITILITSHIFLYITNKDTLINLYGNKIFYRIDRLISFKELNNIQNKNSLISITTNKLIYIPENHNDFIFAAILSKYNFIITILILLSYSAIFIYFIERINNKKNISNILNFTILNMLLFQVFYNILMNLSLVPIIGIPLPFISYGGSNLTTLYILIGLSINNMDNMDMDHTLALDKDYYKL